MYILFVNLFSSIRLPIKKPIKEQLVQLISNIFVSQHHYLFLFVPALAVVHVPCSLACASWLVIIF